MEAYDLPDETPQPCRRRSSRASSYRKPPSRRPCSLPRRKDDDAELKPLPGATTTSTTKQGRSQEFVFFIIRGDNHANLYKNLIKIQIFNVNLGAIGRARPLPAPPYLRPCDQESRAKDRRRRRRHELGKQRRSRTASTLWPLHRKPASPHHAPPCSLPRLDLRRAFW